MEIQDVDGLSASALEKQKTRAQRAEDIAYTINHSIYCTLTDFINPPINAATDNWLRWLVPGCGHDHNGDHKAKVAVTHVHGPACKHDYVHVHGPECEVRKAMPKKEPVHSGACSHVVHAPVGATRWETVKLATRQAFSRERFVQYVKGEFIGDFGAVPITIGMQRLFPGVMDGLRKLSEPLMGPIFKRGIERDSKKWAVKNKVDTESVAYKQHVAEVYEHEMQHFPQAIVWTGASLGLNVGYQMVADNSEIPFMKKAGLKTTSVLSGVLVTAGMVVAARTMAPHRVRTFDKWTSGQFIMPSTKMVGKLFGLDEKTVKTMAEKQTELEHESWAQRVLQQDNVIRSAV